MELGGKVSDSVTTWLVFEFVILNFVEIKVKITCEKTGYHADIDFLTKPFFGGKPHRILGNLYK